MKIFFIAAFIALGISHNANAQITINIGLQPIWGPSGYDYVENYYLPDIDAYYDVQRRVYVYDDGGRWVTSSNIPPRYSNFDLYNAHKVVINERQPWTHHDRDRQQYAQYRGRHDQHPIRDAHEQKYWENPGHPEHNKWHGNPHNNGQGNNRGNGPDRGHSENPGNGHDNGHGNDRGHDNGNGHDKGHDQGHGNDHGNGQGHGEHGHH